MDRRSDNEDMKTLLVGMTSLHGKLDSLQSELLGNGQPGRIQRIESEIQTVEARSNTAIQAVSDKANSALIKLAAIGGGIALFVFGFEAYVHLLK